MTAIKQAYHINQQSQSIPQHDKMHLDQPPGHILKQCCTEYFKNRSQCETLQSALLISHHLKQSCTEHC